MWEVFLLDVLVREGAGQGIGNGLVASEALPTTLSRPRY